MSSSSSSSSSSSIEVKDLRRREDYLKDQKLVYLGGDESKEAVTKRGATDEDLGALYGLFKQASLGDNNHPCPPKDNATLRMKWNAWLQFKGYSQEQALAEYLKMFQKICPEFEAKVDADAKRAGSVATGGSGGGVGSSSTRDSMMSLTPRDTNFGTPHSSSSGSGVGIGGSSASGGGTESKTSIGLVKTGELYKQSNFYKSWNIRYFTLKDKCLYYSRKSDYDCNSSDCFFLLNSVEVKRGPSVVIQKAVHYQFILHDSGSNENYFLCAKDEVDRDDWIQKITEIVKTSDAASGGISGGGGGGGGGGDDADSIAGGGGSDSISENADVKSSTAQGGPYKLAENSDAFPVNVDQTYRNIPRSFHKFVDDSVVALLKMVSSEVGWGFLYEDKGVKAYSKKGAKVTVRGDCKMEHDLLSIFEMIMNKDLSPTVNKQLDLSETKCLLSDNTHIQYMKFKRVVPTAVRDMLVLNHWRLLLSGKVVISSFSLSLIDPEEEDRLMPKDPSGTPVRAVLHIGGYVLTPLSDGTLVQYIVSSDLNGSIPAFVSDTVAKEQPRNVGNIRQYLDDKAKKDNRATPKSFPKQFMFLDLQNVVIQQQGTVYKTIKGRPELEAALNGGGGREGGVGATGTSPVAVPKLFADTSTTSDNSSSSSDASQGGSLSATTADGPSGPLDKIFGFLKPTIRKLYQSLLNPNSKNQLTARSMIVLLLPSVLYFAARKLRIRGLIFFIGLLLSIRYLIRLHLGDPYLRTKLASTIPSEAVSQLPESRITMRFPVSIGPLVMYVQSKKKDFGISPSMQHVLLKACAMTLVEHKRMQGNIHFGSFYVNKTNHVSMSLSVELNEKETGLIKITDLDMKKVEYITQEVQERTKKLRQEIVDKKKESDAKRSRTSSAEAASEGPLSVIQSIIFSPLLQSKIQELKAFLASDLGISVPSLGVAAYPQGLASLVSCPGEDMEVDDISVTSITESAPPIIVTMGEKKTYNVVKSYYNDQNQPNASFLTGLMISVSVDTRAASLTECRKFCNTLQAFMNKPTDLDN